VDLVAQRAPSIERPLRPELLDRLHRDRPDIACARRLKQRLRIGSIGLVPLHVGAHVLCRQQPYFDAARANQPRPVVRRAAGLHHHQPHTAVVEPALELRSGETRSLDDLPTAIGQRELEHVLCQIDCDGSSIHFGLLLSLVSLTPPNDSAWHDDAV